MATQVMATVTGGILKPDEQLPLAEQTRVRLTFEPVAESPESAQAWRTLKERLRQRPIYAAGLHYSRDALHERR